MLTTACFCCSDVWSWRVRFTAVTGLMKICQAMSQDSLKDGLRAVAWNAFRRASSVEKDFRVLEAVKMLSVIRIASATVKPFCF